MSFNPPEGILDIGNATLRVGKLEVAETTGLNQGLQNIVKNDLLITEKETYLANKTWGIKLPTAWVGEFDLKTHDSKYVEFNFYNEGSTSNALGYTLNFKDTTLTLKYDNGNSNLASETIPDVSTSTYKKVNVFFERGVIAVFIDGARVLYFKESDTYNSVHGHPGMASRVASTTGGSFVNIFIEEDGSDSAVKDLRIVNGRLISDKTSNVSFIGSLGVGVNNPKESLDIRGNMHFNRVSNVSQVSVDSNVVTEYTGPHDRPLRKYPEVVLTADDNLSTSGYKASASSQHNSDAFRAFDATGATTYWHSQYPYYTHVTGTYNPGQSASGTGTPANGTTLPTTELISGHQGEWIKLQMPTRIKLEEVRVKASNRAASSVYQMPEDIAIAGSNDGTNWYLVDSGTLQTDIRESYGVATLPITTSSYYSHLALIVKSIDNQGQNYSAAEIANIEYYGREEGDASLDTTLKTVCNVPTTTGTQLEVYYDAKDLTTMPSTVTDLSPNTNSGALSTSPPTLDETDGIKSFKFVAASSQCISATHGLTVPGQPIHSQSVWFKSGGNTGTYQYISVIGTTAANQQAALALTNDGKTLLGSFYGGDREILTIIPNVWYHAVLVYTGTTTDATKYYINGKEVKTRYWGGAGPLSTPTITGTTLKLGANTGNGQCLQGFIANFRLYSKALNADQVKELYDYQKYYFLGSKSQVTLYKGHLGVGVTEPSGQLELAEDVRIQEYPPRSITALNYHTHIEGHGEFEFYSSQSDTNYLGTSWDFTTVFENTERTGGGWHGDGNAGGTGMYQVAVSHAPAVTSGAGLRQSILKDGSAVRGEWIEMRSPYAINITNIATVPRTNYGKSRGIGKFAILGSNNGIDWEYAGNGAIAPHDTSSTTDAGGYGTYQSETIARVSTNSNGYYYTHHRLVVTHIMGHRGASGHPQYSSGAYEEVNVSYLRFYGTRGPTTLDEGSLSLSRSLDVPRISRYDVDTETPRPEKLVIHYDTTVNYHGHDISGQGHHGRFLPSTASQRPYYKPSNRSVVLNGSSSYIFQRDLKQADGNFVHSVSYWLKALPPTNATAETFLYFGSAAVATQDMQIQYNYNGNGTIYFGTQGSWQTLANFGDLGGTGKKITSGEWNHFAYTYNGTDTSTSNMKFYMNGEEMPMGGGGTSALNFTSGETNFYIGRHASSSNPNYFEGEFSNFMMYNTKLEPSEIKKLYRLGRTGRSTVIADTAVGIGCAPEAQLDVRGDLQVRGAIRTPQRPVFYAYNSGAADTTQGFTGHLLFYHTKINVGRCYNTYDKKFYAPVAGYYFFEFQVLAREASGGAGRVETTLYKNNGNISGRAMAYTYLTGSSDHDNLAFTTQLYLDVGDLVHPVIHACDSNMDVYYGEDLGHFSGFFIG